VDCEVWKVESGVQKAKCGERGMLHLTKNPHPLPPLPLSSFLGEGNPLTANCRQTTTDN
jgi:hypothetical protein